MLKLADFDTLSHVLQDPYEQFAQAILNDIARRMSKMGWLSPASQWQAIRLIEAGKTFEWVTSNLAPMIGYTDSELRRVFELYSIKSVRYDNLILRAAGLTPDDLNLSPAMIKVLEAGLRKTQGLLKNLTRSMANTAQDAFYEATDLAYMEVAHGAMSHREAIRYAIKDVAGKGLPVILYPSGRKDQTDVAVRRAVLTGVAQTAGDVQMANFADMGVEHVAVSAHIGARDRGDLPENHEMWQGKVYSLNKDPNYPDFYEWTGYGTIEGLCGVNCRHSFYPFYKGISIRMYDDAQLSTYSKITVPYNGQQIKMYEATQIQRRIEREIRATKRQAEALLAGGFDNQQEIRQIKALQAEMRDFLNQTGLARQAYREGPRAPAMLALEPPPQESPLLEWERMREQGMFGWEMERVKYLDSLESQSPQIEDIDWAAVERAIGNTFAEPMNMQDFLEGKEPSPIPVPTLTRPPEPEPYTGEMLEWRGGLPEENEDVDPYYHWGVDRPLKLPAGGLREAVDRGWVKVHDPVSSRRRGIFVSEKIAVDNPDGTLTLAMYKPGSNADVEVSAYQIDELFDLGICPETVFDDEVRRTASIQLFVKATLGTEMEPGALTHPTDLGKLRLLDALSANFDRHGGNWMERSGRLIGIDHNLSFRAWATGWQDIEGGFEDHGRIAIRYPEEIRDFFEQNLTDPEEGIFSGMFRAPVPAGTRDKLQELWDSGDWEYFVYHELAVVGKDKQEATYRRMRHVLENYDDWFVEVDYD